MRSLAAAVSLSFLACSPSAFGPHGYLHPKEDYRVRSDGSALLGPNWLLDSHYPDGTDSFAPKEGPDWELEYSFDLNGDGRDDVQRTLPLFDMRWEHASDSAVIWTRTIPLPHALASKEPRVLLLNYVENIARDGVTLVTYGDRNDAAVARYGTRVIAQGRTDIGDCSAFAATVEVVNLNQHELDPSAAGHVVTLVVAHSPLAEHPSAFLAGYSARPADHSRHLSTFVDLLSITDLGAGTHPVVLDLQPVESDASE